MLRFRIMEKLEKASLIIRRAATPPMTFALLLGPLPLLASTDMLAERLDLRSDSVLEGACHPALHQAAARSASAAGG